MSVSTLTTNLGLIPGSFTNATTVDVGDNLQSITVSQTYPTNCVTYSATGEDAISVTLGNNLGILSKVFQIQGNDDLPSGPVNFNAGYIVYISPDYFYTPGGQTYNYVGVSVSGIYKITYKTTLYATALSGTPTPYCSGYITLSTVTPSSPNPIVDEIFESRIPFNIFNTEQTVTVSGTYTLQLNDNQGIQLGFYAFNGTPHTYKYLDDENTTSYFLTLEYVSPIPPLPPAQ